MANKDPKYIRDFKEFTKAELTDDDFPALEAELYGVNDRASIVMMGTIIEAALDRFIKYQTDPKLNSDDKQRLFDYSGPLGTFGSKILVDRFLRRLYDDASKNSSRRTEPIARPY